MVPGVEVILHVIAEVWNAERRCWCFKIMLLQIERERVGAEPLLGLNERAWVMSCWLAEGLLMMRWVELTSHKFALAISAEWRCRGLQSLYQEIEVEGVGAEPRWERTLF